MRLSPAAFAAVVLLSAGQAWASGAGQLSNWALNEFGGTTADRQLLFTGAPGVAMGTSPASLLFIFWRRLHGQTVSTEAGEALTSPCCAGSPGGSSPAVTHWLEVRKTVPGVAALGDYLPTEREGPDYTSIPNCLDDAFRNAADTLQSRIGAHGADTPEIKFWVSAQDAVFAACAKPVASLPALPIAPPEWLQQDYRYQDAALAFYRADYPQAAAAFAAIAQDPGSSWRAAAPYLRMRALLRKALASKAPADFAAAREAAKAIPVASNLHASAERLDGMLQLHSDPAEAAKRLVAALSAPTLTAQAASDFKDVQALEGSPAKPELLDWIDTIKTGAAAPPSPPDDPGVGLKRARAADDRRVAALKHARERYAATHDVAWMVAALALMQPDDAGDAGFMAEVAAVDKQAPAYLTALYHRLRLTNLLGDPAGARTLLDTALARGDLTATTRNLLLAERLQVATSLPDMARRGMRKLVCAKDSEGCKTEQWGYDGQGGGSLDADSDPTAGLGDDARYLIDRMALSARVALGQEASLPAPVRLDLALTNFARAVLLHDDGTVDRLSAPLQSLLPPMAADFAAVLKARPGPDKLSAEYSVFAKIPGLRVDLVDYTRPTGAVAEFQGSWPNWVVLQQPDADSVPPAPVLYDNAGNYQVADVPAGTDLGNGDRRIPDAVCDGMCGAGGFVPRAPAFLADTASQATAERRFLPPPGKFGEPDTSPSARMTAFPASDPVKPVPAPSGATYVWEFLLDYAAKHPQDPRVPELLHWLIHVGHYGQSHDHSGRRAFMLLHSRYPNSNWTKQNPFYYD